MKFLELFLVSLKANTKVGNRRRERLRSASNWRLMICLSGLSEASKDQTENLNGQLEMEACCWAIDRSTITPKFTPNHKRNLYKDAGFVLRLIKCLLDTARL